jgi:hypothetical protein
MRGRQHCWQPKDQSAQRFAEALESVLRRPQVAHTPAVRRLRRMLLEPSGEHMGMPDLLDDGVMAQNGVVHDTGQKLISVEGFLQDPASMVLRMPEGLLQIRFRLLF